MTRTGIFAIVAAGAALGAVSGAFAIGKNKRKLRQQPYAAIGSGLLATGAAAVLYNAPTCPPCAPGTVPNGAIASTPSLSQGGYTAAVAFAAALGGVAGAMAVGKQKPSKLLGQQPYAPIGAALLGAGAAAVFYPNAPTCPPCVVAPPAVTAPAPGNTTTAPPAATPVQTSPTPQ
jgi:hypothetical protein